VTSVEVVQADSLSVPLASADHAASALAAYGIRTEYLY